MPYTEDQRAVLRALNHPKFDWRTIDGIMKSTGFSRARVLELIQELGDVVVKSEIPRDDGKDLYQLDLEELELDETEAAILGAIRRQGCIGLGPRTDIPDVFRLDTDMAAIREVAEKLAGVGLLNLGTKEEKGMELLVMTIA
jgi:hypothetical protein